MNINTKQIAGIAAFSLFAFTANAQDAIFTGFADPAFAGPNGLIIEPAPAGAPSNMDTFVNSGAAPGTPVTNIGLTETTVTITQSAGTVSGTADTVNVNGGTSSVDISNGGITLNTVTTQTDTTTLERYTVATTTVDNLTGASSIVYTSYAVAQGDGPNGTQLFQQTGIDLADALQNLDNDLSALNADDALFTSAVVAGAPTTSGGDLTVSGNLALGAIADAEALMNANFQANITNAGDILTNGGLIAGNTTAIGDNGVLIAGNTTAIGDNGVLIAGNAGNIAANTTEIGNNRDDIDRNARGIAMVAALQHTTVLPGMTQALDLSAAHYEGETGMALNYSRRVNETTQLNFGVAATSDFDESVIKGGIGWQW